MVNVPSQYQGIVNQAVQGTGLPEGVVVAQINAESGFQPGVSSSAGAEGMFQFLPSTYTGLGFPAGTEFNPNEEVLAYIKYMNQLLSQEGGSVFKALEAYNAGPGNLSAGSGYASSILSAAGQPVNITSGGGNGSGSGASTTSAVNLTSFPGGAADPLNWPGILGQQVGSQITTGVASLGEAFLQALGIKSVKDLFIRGGLIVFGAILIIIGLVKLSNGSKATDVAVSMMAPEASAAGSASASRSANTNVKASKGTSKVRTERGQVSHDFANRYGTASQPLTTGASEADKQIEKSSKELAE